MSEEKAITPIAKPATAFSLDKFKSKHAAAVANIETLQAGLPHHGIAQAKDFVRLHPDEEAYWSPECVSSMCRSKARSATRCI